MRDDPDEAAENEIRDTEGLIRREASLQPAAVELMTGSVPTMCVDEDVDVTEQDAYRPPCGR